MNKNIFEEITIVIVLYKESINLLSKCLDSIKNFKVIIIDNACDKKLKNEVEKKYKIYKYILNKKNIGFSSGINQGIKESNTQYILIHAADCIISSRDINTLLESHQKYKNCFCTSPTFYDENQKLTYNGDSFYEKKESYEPINLEGDICVDMVITTTVLFKKKDIEEIGLLDENFFLYFDDVDLCRTIKQKKQSIIQVFNAKAQHSHGIIKVNNFFKKIFIRNYHFTFDELYYFYKVNKHSNILKKLEKKIPNYFIKSLINIFLFRYDKVISYISIIFGYLKFKKFLKKNI
jgi:GT2 family glycosyltransferase